MPRDSMPLAKPREPSHETRLSTSWKPQVVFGRISSVIPKRRWRPRTDRGRTGCPIFTASPSQMMNKTELLFKLDKPSPGDLLLCRVEEIWCQRRDSNSQTP